VIGWGTPSIGDIGGYVGTPTYLREVQETLTEVQMSELRKRAEDRQTIVTLARIIQEETTEE
jgi:hypothetical protein